MRIVKNIKSTYYLRFVIVAALLFSSAALVGAADNNNGKDFMRIIYSGGLQGNIQPCG